MMAFSTGLSPLFVVHWYDVLIAGISGLAIFPDKILRWFADLIGRRFRWWYLLCLEGTVVLSLVLVMKLLMRVIPQMSWERSLVIIAIVFLLRSIFSLAADLSRI